MSVTIDQLESELAKQKALIERAESAQRLAKNRDFRKLILEDFLVTECANYAQLSGDPALPPENRADALAISQAAGHLRRYLSMITQMGINAANQMDRREQELAEARAEEDEV